MTSREIKFRAWDGLANPPHMVTDTDDAIGLLNTEADVMQYTGLKDKNGREIFEGDILKFESLYMGYVVFEYAEFITKGRGDYALSPKATNSDETLEVIGNIYENPELLEDY